MQVSLGRKQTFVGLPNGKTLDVFNNKGPVEIDVYKLDTAKKAQMLTLIDGKIVQARSPSLAEEVQHLRDTVEVAPAANPVQPLQIPIPDYHEKQQQLEVKVRKILRETMKVVKLQAKDLTVQELQKLIEIEKITKNRKGLLSYLGELMGNIHSSIQQEMQASQQDMQELQSIEQMFNKSMLPEKYQKQLSEVEETEMEEKEVTVPIDMNLGVGFVR